MTSLALLAVLLTGLAPLACCCAAGPDDFAGPAPAVGLAGSRAAHRCCERGRADSAAPSAERQHRTADPHPAAHSCRCEPIVERAPQSPVAPAAVTGFVPPAFAFVMAPLLSVAPPGRAFDPPWSGFVTPRPALSLLSLGCMLTI